MDHAHSFGVDLASCSANIESKSYYQPLLNSLGLSRKEVEKVKQKVIERRLSTPFLSILWSRLVMTLEYDLDAGIQTFEAVERQIDGLLQLRCVKIETEFRRSFLI